MDLVTHSLLVTRTGVHKIGDLDMCATATSHLFNTFHLSQTTANISNFHHVKIGSPHLSLM